MLLDAFPALGPTARVGPVNLARLAGVFLSSGRGLSERWFTSPAARRVLPGLALHADVGPDDRFGAALGFMLGMAAATSGYVVPEGVPGRSPRRSSDVSAATVESCGWAAGSRGWS